MVTEGSFVAVTSRGAPKRPQNASARLGASVSRTDHLVVRATVQQEPSCAFNLDPLQRSPFGYAARAGRGTRHS